MPLKYAGTKLSGNHSCSHYLNIFVHLFILFLEGWEKEVKVKNVKDNTAARVFFHCAIVLLANNNFL